MKNTILLFIFVTSISSILFADYAITRGPDIGEIYFKGPLVYNDFGIFHTTDFGETITCVDSLLGSVSIAADLTPGGLYYVNMGGGLFYSDNYGQQGSWEYRNSDISECINSGVFEGEIYSSYSKHSEDYGLNFINHTANGYFGLLKTVSIDNEDQVAYALVYEWGIQDSLWLLITYDHFDNLEIQHVFNFNALYPVLSRGTSNGELYFYTENPLLNGKELRYSNDYGITWELKNTFNCPNLPIISIVGGRQPGELYMLVIYIQVMQLIKHLYLYHSIDYGETFTIYHPIAIGPEPNYANFEATPTSGTAPLTVQFTDLSSGDPSFIVGWEWDFDDDGVIDSYEQHPEYTYQDTGLYSVRLHIITGGGIGEEAHAYRKDYIHVTDGSGVDNYELRIVNYELNNYPNPFNPITTIYFTAKNAKDAKLEIYNLKGQKIKKLEIRNLKLGINEIIWDGTDNDNKPVSSGIYLYKIKSDDNVSISKKMILLR